MKNFISIKDLSREKILCMVENAMGMIPHAKNRNKPPRIPKGVKTTLFFMEPSTRTCGSYNEAATILEFDKNEISGIEATSLVKKESIADTARMFAAQNTNVLVMRTPWEGTPRFVVEILNNMGYGIAVQNAGDGSNQHPSQTMLDLLTIKQTLGKLENFKLGLVGDLKHSRTVHSLLQALCHFHNISLKLFSTAETKLQEEYYVGKFQNAQEVHSLRDLVGCDIVYATRLQRERFRDKEELKRAEGAYLINKTVLDLWGDNIIIMHPLPCVDEISSEIKSDHRVLMYKQAWYGIPTRMALLKEGYEYRLDSVYIPQPKKFEAETVGFSTISDKIDTKRKTGRYFASIKNGTLIDHITTDESNTIGKGDKIKLLLRNLGVLPHKGITIAEGVESPKYKLKDVIVAENVEIPEYAAFLVTLVAPNATFNYFNGKTSTKIKIRVPEMICGLRCPNDTCITNHDPEARAKFTVEKQNNRMCLTCYYCEQTFSGEKIVFHHFL